jgi:hypothetical protein
MNRASPLAREIAKQIVAFEASGDKSAGAHASAALRATESLRIQLTRTIGAGGYFALASRALALAQTERGLPAFVRIADDGSLEGFAEFAAGLQPAVAQSDGQTILAHLVDLLLMFIGETIVLRVILNVWTKVPVKAPGSDSEDIA